MKTVLNFAKDAGNMINDQLILFFWLILQLFILTSQIRPQMNIVAMSVL